MLCKVYIELFICEDNNKFIGYTQAFYIYTQHRDNKSNIHRTFCLHVTYQQQLFVHQKKYDYKL